MKGAAPGLPERFIPYIVGSVEAEPGHFEERAAIEIRDERQAAFAGKPREDWRLPAPGQGAEDRQHRGGVVVVGE